MGYGYDAYDGAAPRNHYLSLFGAYHAVWPDIYLDRRCFWRAEQKILRAVGFYFSPLSAV